MNPEFRSAFVMAQYKIILLDLIAELRDRNARYMSENWDGDDLSTEFAIALDRAEARLRDIQGE